MAYCGITWQVLNAQADTQQRQLDEGAYLFFLQIAARHAYARASWTLYDRQRHSSETRALRATETVYTAIAHRHQVSPHQPQGELDLEQQRVLNQATRAIGFGIQNAIAENPFPE